MLKALKIDSVRGRLTLFYVSTLAASLLLVGGLIYALLAQVLYSRIDDSLVAVVQITTTSLTNDLAEGQDVEDAARSTAAELSSRLQMLAIYDERGSLLAEDGRDDDLDIVLPPLDTIPVDETMLITVAEVNDDDDRHRLAMQQVDIAAHRARYIVVVGSSLEPTDEELEWLRTILAWVVPIALLAAGVGGWFLARQSLSPVVDMADRARRIGAENLSERLPVANARDELGRLAGTFNELLARLEAAMTQQRQFMADASHELRTPVAITRTAASVTLQQPHRDESEYRETLAIVEREAARLSRVVDDLFTLARADAGNFPVHLVPMYLDEVVEEVVRASRILAAEKNVSVELRNVPSAAFTGDEDLLRRMIGNLLDNAVRVAPSGSTVQVTLQKETGLYEVAVSDAGPGIPVEIQVHIFERFYRGDTDRARAGRAEGAGLGLALSRWIARVHHGDVVLTQSSDAGTTFTARLPQNG